MRRLHNQFPTTTMTDEEYEVALVHLCQQIGAQGVAYSEEAYKEACDALAHTFGTTEDQTVLDWIKAACAKVGANADACAGL
ncbi:hypothetical protein UFOVP1302_41 [uncultured Caudovirales phage]|uniref:Uncharacterized protein n=1 Tax=uncultured Caudovirales phage TaxID=2100421 RepID=A0A6J5PPU1_9CAUD|nr:hypothetical protein UFOVP895_44 [uncultured Caudovirales phage]CAB4181517.1 hypothetical protein UFOVP1070_43 [uncultured Caudovirales phage]CAB4195895.1 hypothetical protein UFOVP1302_41 [uncultured Caudovirales phage]CAB4211936.1 hypothetical protein UFOVP1416_71 [uncultured Caudovirales phage]